MFNFFKKKHIDESLEEQRKDLKKFSHDSDNFFPIGIECDELPNTTGEFGRTVTNPIPVNGPIGEIKYLNRLNTEDGGILFHRLGAINSIDIFETVSVNGKYWNILYLDMYHPRRSTKVPNGFSFGKFHEVYSRSVIGFYTTKYDPDFPFGLSPHIKQNLGEGLGESFAKRYEAFVQDKSKFVRPQQHIDELKSLRFTSRSS